MSSIKSAYFLIGVFAVVALYLSIQWLFLSMLLLLGALAVADSLSHSSTHEHVEHAPAKTEQQQPPRFLDGLLSNLAGQKYALKEQAKIKKAEKEAAEKGDKKEGH